MNWLNWFKSDKGMNTALPVNTAQNWRTISEPYTGAWQKNDELQVTDSLTSYAVFSCISLISKDVGKLPIVVKTEEDGIVSNVKLDNLTVLNKPNNYQTRQQFFEAWINSKASKGNTYILKQRDVYGDIVSLLVLDPDKVTVLVDPSGNVFYKINIDTLTGITEQLTVPASEIIHDRYNCFYHPLIGLSPIIACGLAANTGLNIQHNAKDFFGNMSRPSGILVSPEAITPEDALEIKTNWDKRYSHGGLGGTAVLGDGVSYQALSVPASDSQMIEHLKLSGEIVCSTYHVPSFKVGVGSIPVGTKIADLNEIYYSDCLQSYIESIENLLNCNLDLPNNVVVEFNLKALIRMDSLSQMAYLKEGTGSGILTPNEARAELGYKPVEGGNSPMIQQQNYSLEAIAKRDAKEDPFTAASKAPTAVNTESATVTMPTATNVPVEASKSLEDVLQTPEAVLQTLYQGVFSDSKTYQKGNFITYKGSLWHCDNKHIGNFNYDNFTLAVKKGESENVNKPR